MKEKSYIFLRLLINLYFSFTRIYIHLFRIILFEVKNK